MTARSKSAKRVQVSRASGARRAGVARVLSKLGIASRTVAAQWVAAGRVTVNGRRVLDPEAAVVMGRDRVSVDGKPVRAVEKRYVMLNKPRGLVTTARDEWGRATVYDCFKADEGRRLAAVGRLDKASEGLLLFSNDTAWANRLLDPASHLPKVYHVQVDAVVSVEQLDRMSDGITMEDGSRLGVSRVRVVRRGAKTCWLEITLDEGRNRQIRRVMEALGLQVKRLVRIAIGPLRLGSLIKGECRTLTAAEMEALEAALVGNKDRR